MGDVGMCHQSVISHSHPKIRVIGSWLRLAIHIPVHRYWCFEMVSEVHTGPDVIPPGDLGDPAEGML